MHFLMIALAFAAPSSASGDPDPSSDKTFKFAKLEVRDGKPGMGPWQPMKKVSTQDTSIVRVVAPWCGGSRQFLGVIQEDELVDRFDLIAIPQFELSRAERQQFDQYEGLDVHVMENRAAQYAA